MAEQDYRVGQVVDCVEQAGISDNTLIVFSSDNAALDQGVPNAWGRLQRPVPRLTPFLPMFFDLWSDPHERCNLTNFRFDFDFMFHVLLKIGIEYELSTVEYPNIKPGTPDDFDGYHGANHLENGAASVIEARLRNRRAAITPASCRGGRAYGRVGPAP